MSDTSLGRTIMALAIMGIVGGSAIVTYTAVQHVKLIVAEVRQ